MEAGFGGRGGRNSTEGLCTVFTLFISDFSFTYLEVRGQGTRLKMAMPVFLPKFSIALEGYLA